MPVDALIDLLRSRRWLVVVFSCVVISLGSSCGKPEAAGRPPAGAPGLRTFPVQGVVRALKPESKTIVIQHEAVTNYMEAMTMPFRVKEAGHLAELRPGDEISFRLSVSESESWIDQIVKTGRSLPVGEAPAATVSNAVPVIASAASLLDFKFTNEFSQPVSFNDFKGQAVAFTFFFTRCPIPEYCPRLMKNFAEASEKLRTLPDAPTNWHMLAISFDTKFDTPAVLRAYARQYNYDTNHWTFLTGPPEKVAELAGASGVHYEADGNTFNHSFRTLVLDAAGRLQMSFPIGGNLSDLLVGEIIKAAAVTNR